MPIIFLAKCLKCPSFHSCPAFPRRRFLYISRKPQPPCKLPKQKAAEGLYYDLITVPHGHIPAPKTNLWSHFPMPVKEYRDYDYYHCPQCGDPSFFKINYICRDCEEQLEWSDSKYEERIWRRYKRKQRRKYWKELFKRIEYLILPFLVLTGKAWYVRSLRHHHEDP